MNKLMAFVAFAIFTAFLAILAIWVPSPDLVAIVVLTVCLLAYDFLTSARDRKE